MRFKKYDTNWDRKKLSDYVKKITRKNTNNVIKNVICNSAQNGLIPQLDFFEKKIANDENTAGYYIISNGDFVYNPRKSLSAPYGPVNIYKYDSAGIVSPLYLCFSVDDRINKSFLLQRFKSPCWYRYIYLNGDSGVRHDRVSIKDEVFLSQPINLPNAEEQAAIVDFLKKIDERIFLQNKIISKYETLIKGFCNLLLQEIENIPRLKLSDILIEYNDKTTLHNEYPILSSTMSGIFVQSEYFNKQTASEETIGYKKVPYGYCTYRSMSDTGEFRFNLQKKVNIGIVSPVYPVFTSKIYNMDFVSFYLNKSDYFRKQILETKEGGTRFALSYSKLSRLTIPNITRIKQKQIVEIYYTFLHKLELEQSYLDKLKEQKNYLLSKMFI